MKHIYIVDEHQSSKQNGVGTYIRQLLKCFEGSGHDVNLLSFNSDEKEFGIEQQSFYMEYRIPPCGINGFLNNGKLALSILKLYIEDTKDNVFFVNHFPCDKFLADIKLIFPLSRIIFVIHDQGWCAPLFGDVEMFRKVLKTTYYPPKNRKEWQEIRQITSRERRMYHLADDVIALANTTFMLLIDLYGVSADKIHLIPNGLQDPITSEPDDVSSIRKRLGVEEDEIVLLYTGRTSPSKGIVPMLQAFERLWTKNPKLHLVIAGQVFSLNDFAKQTPQSITHITFAGLLPKRQLEDWYKIADIGILPSYTEQSSYSGIEMLAFGKLIVTTNGHNLNDMFNDETAIVAHIGNKQREKASLFVSSLTEAIDKALNLGANERRHIQIQARKQYTKAHSFYNWKTKYIRLIKD